MPVLGFTLRATSSHRYHRTELALRRLDLDGAGAALGGELTQSGRQCKKLTQ